MSSQTPSRLSSKSKTGASIVGLGAAALFIYGIGANDPFLQLITKPWPVLVLAWIVHQPAGDRYGKYIRNGLLASVVGDVCLEFELGFLPGMGAFFVAHVFYLLAYLGRDRTPRLWLALPFAAWGVITISQLSEGLRAAGLLIPVAIYTAVICAMLWRAWARCRTGITRDVWIAAVGATLFAISDTMIAVSMFGPGFAGSDYWIIVLYWLGQSGIAYSALPLREHLD